MKIDLRNKWTRVKSHLNEASKLLSREINTPNWVNFDEYIDHNELELAYDVLAEIASEQKPIQEFDLHMKKAQDKMGLIR